MQDGEHHCNKPRHWRSCYSAWERETMQLSLSGQGAPEVAWFPFPVDVKTGMMNLAVQLRTAETAFVLELGFAAILQSAAAGRS